MQSFRFLPKSRPNNKNTHESCPVCGIRYDYVDVIDVREYSSDMDRRPICTRVSNGLIEVYYHENLIGGESFI